MDSLVTFCIPIGLRHQHLAQRAIASANAQTVPVEILTMLDHASEGPGVLRNTMLREVTTPFVSFLDADDWIEPTFAEETLNEYNRIGGGKYIFTDWLTPTNDIVVTPCLNNGGLPMPQPGAKPYCGGTWHVVTTLLPTSWALAVGGFDETMMAAEDTDFYLKLCNTKHCGHHLGRALFHYSPGGGRAESFIGTIALDQTMAELTRRYSGKMGCCSDDTKVEPPVGARQPGDVVARALWIGKRVVHGRSSGRHYPNISAIAMQNTAWVDPRDAQMNPDLWEIVTEVKPDNEPPAPAVNLRQIGQIMLTNVKQSPYAPPQNEPPVPEVVQGERNVNRIVSLAKKAVGIEGQIVVTQPPDFNLTGLVPSQQNVTAEQVEGVRAAYNAAHQSVVKNFVPIRDPGDPVFVFADKDYPSYTDIRRLVALSGYRSMPLSKVDVFSRAPLIVVSPEPIGDRFRGVPSRVICWQLEYAGDYINNYAEFGGEIWGSDAVWCKTHGAKYVLMGSHDGLASGEYVMDLANRVPYDVTMLAYMTPRRQAIKDQLSDLQWPENYPGHGTGDRHQILSSTRIMLHVHQHDNAPFVAPQRFALAAAYHMPVISEYLPGHGDLQYVYYSEYDKMADNVRTMLRDPNMDNSQLLHYYLCVERPFRQCVEQALK